MIPLSFPGPVDALKRTFQLAYACPHTETRTGRKETAKEEPPRSKTPYCLRTSAAKRSRIIYEAWRHAQRNSVALKHPRSGTCFNSSCWNLWEYCQRMFNT